MQITRTIHLCDLLLDKGDTCIIQFKGFEKPTYSFRLINFLNFNLISTIYVVYADKYVDTFVHDVIMLQNCIAYSLAMNLILMF